MKTKIFAALLLAAPFLAHAQAPVAVDPPCMAKMGHHQPHGGHAFGGHEPTPPFLRGINLSEAQKDKIFELMHKQAPLLREKAKASHQAMDELRQLSLADNFDEARAKKLAHSAADAQSEIALQHAQNDQKIIAMLTPEQRKEVTANSAGKAKPRG
jgi:Spy/CpxP family protein refolding chaperone